MAVSPKKVCVRIPRHGPLRGSFFLASDAVHKAARRPGFDSWPRSESGALRCREREPRVLNSRDFNIVCPICRGTLEEVGPDRLRCATDGVDFTQQEGIWRLPTPQQMADAEKFLSDYRQLRSDEGWGNEDPSYYREIPFRDITGRHSDIWRIRAESYRLLKGRVLTGGRRRIADLGAGNCWLSWRLGKSGHSVAAVDLSIDTLDGLGAAGAYGLTGETVAFPRMQALIDATPFADGEFDLAIFNGSFHYSSDCHQTLVEAKRLVAPAGRVIIMDSPVYRSAASGERMVRQREEDWRQRFGHDFGTHQTVGFLTRRGLGRLGRAVGLRWRIHPLPLGWRWHLGPLAALVLGRPEPARFPLVIGYPTVGEALS